MMLSHETCLSCCQSTYMYKSCSIRIQEWLATPFMLCNIYLLSTVCRTFSVFQPLFVQICKGLVIEKNYSNPPQQSAQYNRLSLRKCTFLAACFIVDDGNLSLKFLFNCYNRYSRLFLNPTSQRFYDNDTR